nr:hypothetical protein [Tanacetum cinerariifolium]
KKAPQPPGHAPPSPNYMHGHEHPPSQDYIPGPEHPEYLVPSDDKVPIDDQPLHDDASLTALSPSYVVDFDPSEEDPEENPKKDAADGGEKAFEIDESAPTPLSPPTHTSPTYAEAPLGYRAAMIRSRAASLPLVPSPRLRKDRIVVEVLIVGYEHVVMNCGLAGN